MKIIGALLAVAAFSTSVVYGCQCGEKPTVAQAMERAEVVATGTVRSLNPMPGSPGFSPRRVVLAVDRVWKGSGVRDLKLVVGSSTCDYVKFEAERDYLVFVERRDDATMYVSECLPNQLVSEAAALLPTLGTAVSVGETGRARNKGVLLVVALVCALVLCAALYCGFR